MKLKEKHVSFCEKYVKDLNAAQAAIRARYSPKTANQQGHRLLTYAHVQARDKALQAQAAERNWITTDKILGKLEIVYERTLEEGMLAAANRAAELQAKLAGLFVERAETRLHATFAPASADELDTEIVRLANLAGYSLTRNEH